MWLLWQEAIRKLFLKESHKKSCVRQVMSTKVLMLDKNKIDTVPMVRRGGGSMMMMRCFNLAATVKFI